MNARAHGTRTSAERSPSKPQPSLDGLLQRRCACGDPAQLAGAPSSLIESVLRSPGSPLEPAVHSVMEQRFGHNFSRVRVHSDGRAAASARAIQAMAYTVHPHIVFGAERYSPSTNDGRRLLAHELTHVVQQERTGPPSPASLRIDPDQRHEREARRAETHDVGALSDAPTGVLQRQPDAALCGGTWTCAATPCANPDPGREGDGSSPTTWTLKVMVDIEAPTAADVSATALNIGHTYTEFVDSTGRVYTFGFYPDKSAGTPDPMFHPAVAGCVVHADTNHRSCVDYEETFTLTKEQFDAALGFAQSLCAAPPTYHIQTWNCTTFAVEVTRRAGKSLPPVRGRVGSGTLSTVADNPNTLFEGLKRRDVGPTWGLTGDTDIRDAITAADPPTIVRIPLAEKLRIVNRLLDGWVSDDDIASIRKVYRNTPPDQRLALKRVLEARLLDLTDIGQRTQMRVILAGG